MSVMGDVVAGRFQLVRMFGSGTGRVWLATDTVLQRTVALMEAGPEPAALALTIDAEGAFANLDELSPGDQIIVAPADGSEAIFVVTRVEQHAKTDFPTAAVYGPIDHAGLRLVTCGGAFDRATRHYRDNVVVFADLREARTR